MWVMTRAWYGVSSTRNQAGWALDQLAELGSDLYSKGKICIQRDRYVDALHPGADTVEQRGVEIIQTVALLEMAGFEPKHITKSGEAPCDKASSDGESVKLLGYKWMVDDDILAP